MQIALLQLSDIHIKSTRDPLLTRARVIAAALHDAAPHASACIVVISGDVAFSGQVAQYDAALKFFDELRTALAAYPAIKFVEFVAIPGNHDCDLEHESDIREFLLRDIEALYESDVQPDGGVAKAILRVHDNFFSFNATLTKGKNLPFPPQSPALVCGLRSHKENAILSPFIRLVAFGRTCDSCPRCSLVRHRLTA